MRSPPRNRPATTPTSSTRTSSWPSTWWPTWCSTGCARPTTSNWNATSCWKRSHCARTIPRERRGTFSWGPLFGEPRAGARGWGGGAPGGGDGGIGVVDDAGTTELVSRPPVHPRADDRRGRRQRRPRSGDVAGSALLRRAVAAQAHTGGPAQGRRPRARASDTEAGQPGRRADPHDARRPRSRAALETPLGAVGAERRHRWRPQLAAVPADPRGARAGVHGVLHRRHVR